MFNRNCVIGAQLPEFDGTTMDGKKIDKSYFEGKVSVINFWFEGCMSCEHEMPYFNTLVEKYKVKNVNFLAISLNSPKDITDFLVTHPYNFDHIAYGEPITAGNFKMTWGYPTTLVVDKHLKIIYTTGGVADENGNVLAHMDLDPKIELALNEN
ncbi:MAG: TlpA disulfide reductase family protein [Saprospiraceae bacterium]